MTTKPLRSQEETVKKLKAKVKKQDLEIDNLKRTTTLMTPQTTPLASQQSTPLTSQQCSPLTSQQRTPLTSRQSTQLMSQPNIPLTLQQSTPLTIQQSIPLPSPQGTSTPTDLIDAEDQYEQDEEIAQDLEPGYVVICGKKVDELKIQQAKLNPDPSKCALQMMAALFTPVELVNGNPFGFTNSKDEL